MKKLTRLLSLLLAALMLTTTASVGAFAEETVSGKLRIAINGFTTEDTETALGLGHLLEKFTEQYPDIEIVSLEAIPNENWEEKATTMLMSGAVDVIYASLYNAYSQGLIYNLKDLIDRDCPDIWDKFIDGAKYTERVSFGDDHIIGLPCALSAQTLVYDKQILDDFGVTLSMNPTPEEIYEVAKACTGINPRTGEQCYGLYFPISSGQSIYSLDELAGGVSYGTFDRLDYSQAELEIYSEKHVEQVTYWSQFLEFLPPDAVTGGAENFFTENNNIAIYMRSGASEILKETQLYDRYIYTYGVDTGDNTTSYNAPMTWCIASSIDEANLEAAWKLIQFLTDYEAQQFYFEQYMAIPALKEAPFMTETEDPFAKNVMAPLYTAVNKQARNMYWVPFCLKNFRPWLNTLAAQALAGEELDIEGGLKDLDDQVFLWQSEQLPLELLVG